MMKSIGQIIWVHRWAVALVAGAPDLWRNFRCGVHLGLVGAVLASVPHSPRAGGLRVTLPRGFAADRSHPDPADGSDWASAEAVLPGLIRTF